MNIDGDIVAKEALLWLGTPYHRHAYLRSVGCDCYGLIRGVYQQITGYLPDLFYPYDNEYLASHDTMKLYKHEIEKYCDDVTDKPWQVGDILWFGKEEHPVHCSILLSENKMIHSHQEKAIKKVVISTFSEFWKERHRATARFLSKPREQGKKWQLLY